MGFLPNLSIEDMMQMIHSKVEKTVRKHGGHVQVNFNALKNDSYIMPENENIVQEMLKVCIKNRVKQNGVYGWNVSCDARMYYKGLGIPTIIFGCGHLENAHSKNEHINIEELKTGMKIFSDFLLRRP